MKNLIIFLVIGFSTEIYASQVNCEYIRNETGYSALYKERFELMPSRSDWDHNLRNYAYKVRLADESFTVEVREGTQKKVATRSVKNIWKGIREPKAPELSFEFPDVKIIVRCK